MKLELTPVGKKTKLKLLTRLHYKGATSDGDKQTKTNKLLQLVFRKRYSWTDRPDVAFHVGPEIGTFMVPC